MNLTIEIEFEFGLLYSAQYNNAEISISLGGVKLSHASSYNTYYNISDSMKATKITNELIIEIDNIPINEEVFFSNVYVNCI